MSGAPVDLRSKAPEGEAHAPRKSPQPKIRPAAGSLSRRTSLKEALAQNPMPTLTFVPFNLRPYPGAPSPPNSVTETAAEMCARRQKEAELATERAKVEAKSRPAMRAPARPAVPAASSMDDPWEPPAAVAGPPVHVPRVVPPRTDRAPKQARVEGGPGITGAGHSPGADTPPPAFNVFGRQTTPRLAVPVVTQEFQDTLAASTWTAASHDRAITSPECNADPPPSRGACAAASEAEDTGAGVSRFLEVATPDAAPQTPPWTWSDRSFDWLHGDASQLSGTAPANAPVATSDGAGPGLPSDSFETADECTEPSAASPATVQRGEQAEWAAAHQPAWFERSPRLSYYGSGYQSMGRVDTSSDTAQHSSAQPWQTPSGDQPAADSSQVGSSVPDQARRAPSDDQQAAASSQPWKSSQWSWSWRGSTWGSASSWGKHDWQRPTSQQDDASIRSGVWAPPSSPTTPRQNAAAVAPTASDNAAAAVGPAYAAPAWQSSWDRPWSAPAKSARPIVISSGSSEAAGSERGSASGAAAAQPSPQSGAAQPSTGTPWRTPAPASGPSQYCSPTGDDAASDPWQEDDPWTPGPMAASRHELAASATISGQVAGDTPATRELHRDAVHPAHFQEPEELPPRGIKTCREAVPSTEQLSAHAWPTETNYAFIPALGQGRITKRATQDLERKLLFHMWWAYHNKGAAYAPRWTQHDVWKWVHASRGQLLEVAWADSGRVGKYRKFVFSVEQCTGTLLVEGRFYATEHRRKARPEEPSP